MFLLFLCYLGVFANVEHGKVPVRDFEEFKANCLRWKNAYDSERLIELKNKAAKAVAQLSGHEDCAFLKLCGQHFDPARYYIAN